MEWDVERLMVSGLKEIRSFMLDCENKEIEHLYYDKDDWKQLMDIIIEWYKIKYPDNKLNMIKEKYKNIDKIILSPKDYDYIDVESLSKYMGFSELMFRIPTKLHPLIECWYTGKMKGHISLNNTINKVDKYFEINEYGDIIKLDSSFDDTILKRNCRIIDEFVEHINDNTYDVNDMKKIIKTHNLNLELRNKYFKLIVYLLIISAEDRITGYIRAIRFIEEFNEYLDGLNLSKNCVAFIAVSDLSIDNKPILGNDILKDIEYILANIKHEDKDKDIDTFGLTFKTLKRLKKTGIKKLSDLKNKEMYDIVSDHGIFNYNIPEKDQIKLRNMFKQVEEYNNKIKEEIAHNIIQEYVTREHFRKKTKKKSLFFKKQK